MIGSFGILFRITLLLAHNTVYSNRVVITTEAGNNEKEPTRRLFPDDECLSPRRDAIHICYSIHYSNSKLAIIISGLSRFFARKRTFGAKMATFPYYFADCFSIFARTLRHRPLVDPHRFHHPIEPSLSQEPSHKSNHNKVKRQECLLPSNYVYWTCHSLLPFHAKMMLSQVQDIWKRSLTIYFIRPQGFVANRHESAFSK